MSIRHVVTFFDKRKTIWQVTEHVYLQMKLAGFNQCGKITVKKLSSTASKSTPFILTGFRSLFLRI